MNQASPCWIRELFSLGCNWIRSTLKSSSKSQYSHDQSAPFKEKEAGLFVHPAHHPSLRLPLWLDFTDTAARQTCSLPSRKHTLTLSSRCICKMTKKTKTREREIAFRPSLSPDAAVAPHPLVWRAILRLQRQSSHSAETRWALITSGREKKSQDKGSGVVNEGYKPFKSHAVCLSFPLWLPYCGRVTPEGWGGVNANNELFMRRTIREESAFHSTVSRWRFTYGDIYMVIPQERRADVCILHTMQGFI